MPITTRDIAVKVGGELAGPGDVAIRGIETLEAAGPDQITFIRDSVHAPGWAASRAGAALVTRGVAVEPAGRAVIFVADADLAAAVMLDLFAPPPVRPPAGVHPKAIVDPSASLGPGVAIGAGCVIGAHVHIGKNTILHPGVTILDHTTVGANGEIYPGVVIRERCTLGDRVILHPNAVIGSDGFGYRPSTDPKRPGLVKLTHIGTVQIGHDVEIGAASCVDRGKFSATVIGDGTKIDNLCQIAHNVRIGRHCAIAGQTSVGGSVTIGDGVIVAGCVAIKDHVTLGAGCRVGARAGVIGDVPPGETWGGCPARDIHQALREYASMRKLPELVKLLKKSQKPEAKSH